MNMQVTAVDGSRTLGHFVDGAERTGTSGRFGQVFNPANRPSLNSGELCIGAGNSSGDRGIRSVAEYVMPVMK